MRKAATATVLAGSTFLLNGCGDSGEPAAFYRSIQECQDDNPLYTFSCEQAHTRALLESEQSAPKYSSIEDCEFDFGQGKCMQSSNGQYMPEMSGFLLAQVSDDFYDYDDPEPIYHYRGHYVGGSGYKYGSKQLAKKLTVPSDTFKSKLAASSHTLSRGGFGSVVAAKAYSGSSSGSRGSSGRSGGFFGG